VWILIALLGLLGIVALYILWFRTGGLYTVADSREMFKADSRFDSWAGRRSYHFAQRRRPLRRQYRHGGDDAG
jgi:hypothetical protein